MDERSCPFCGKPIRLTVSRCPYCREAVSAVNVNAGAARPRASSVPGEGRTYIRRGLLWALLAVVIYYFAGGHSGFTLPFEVPGFVNQYLVPVLFLAGVAMAIFGFFRG